MSPWEAQIVIEVIREVYFATPGNAPLRHGKLLGPQCYKTFEGALNSFIAAECPQIGGLLNRKALVNAIARLVSAHYPNSTHMAQGQIRWTAVHKDEKSSYGKTIAQSQLTPVVLDLLPHSEVQARAEGARLREVKKQAVARLFTQAYEQHGVLTNCEPLSILELPRNGARAARQTPRIC